MACTLLSGPLIERLRGWLRTVLLVVMTALLVLVVLDAMASRRLPDLAIWHRVDLPGEFRRDSGVDDFESYLQLEQRLFDRLQREVIDRYQPASATELNRYVSASLASPTRFEQDYNRSYQQLPAEPVGAVVLLHGLTDSPYSLRHVGQLLYEQGFAVVSLRLPGHGTVPVALDRVQWEDWADASALAVRHAQELLEPGQPLYLAGYSNGAALALNHVADDLLADGETRVDRLLLFAPSLGVTPLALLANTHRLVSFMPWFEKSRWLSVIQEIDPFKYQSFTRNGAWQVRRLTRQLDGKLARLFDGGGIEAFPAVFTALSVVDATVSVQSVVNLLFDRLRDSRHHLLLFDINHVHRAEGYMRPGIEDRLRQIYTAGAPSYTRTVLSNLHTGDSTVQAWRASPGRGSTRQPTGLVWPPELFSMSHVSLLFPPDDPLYGRRYSANHLSLGAIDVKGETGLLQLADSALIRVRFNPFFSYLQQALQALVSQDRGPADGESRE